MIESAAELYVHAIAIEREAAERYAEFARRMADEGNDEVAAVLRKLAGLETEHLEALQRRTAGIALPKLETDYQWLDTGAPEAVAHDLVFRLMTPSQALAVALDAEKRAHAFFNHVQHVAADPALRALAKEMAAEEEQHIVMLLEVIQRVPSPFVDWASIYQTTQE
jgi:rubrerythrin